MKSPRLVTKILAAVVLTTAVLTLQPSAEAKVDTPATVLTGSNGFGMGGLPNFWTICVANGYGPTAGLITNWNWEGHRLAVHVQNRCDGYSITNRMTIDNYSATNAPCITFGNTHTTKILGRKGKNIFDQNVIVYINTAAPCFDNNIELYHNIQRGVGYVLGLSYNPVLCFCIQGSTQEDINNIPYVTNGDALDMAVDYDN